MGGVPYRMWVAYYLLLLSHQGVKPKRLLDVCCGTGTMCEMLVQEGFSPDGFDLSEPMIRVARKKAAEKNLAIRYECMDAATFDMGETYDAAYSFFDSLNYITDPDQLQRALKRVAAHLPSEGSFIFDVNTAYAFEADMFSQENLKSKSKVRYKWRGEWDPATQMIAVHMRFWHGDEEIEETHYQRAYDDDQIRAMLADAGFIDIRAFHSYTLNPPRFKSDRLHYTAIKA